MKVVRKSVIITTHVVMILGAILMLYPFVFAILGTMTTAEDLIRSGSILPVPNHPLNLFTNLRNIFRQEGIAVSILLTLGRFAWYAFILSATSVLGGYAFAKIRFKGKKIAFYVLMSSMMIPGIAMLIPQYKMLMGFPLVGGNDIHGMGGFGFRDNPAVLFILGWFSAYNIFLVRQMLSGIGNEYKEAAEIDGAGFLRIVFSIYMPMLTPVIALIVIQTFIGQWNDYLFPTIFLGSTRELWPIGVLSVKIQSSLMYDVRGGGIANYPMALAMGVVMMIPPVVVFIAFQKYFVQGLTLGGVKS